MVSIRFGIRKRSFRELYRNFFFYIFFGFTNIRYGRTGIPLHRSMESYCLMMATLCRGFWRQILVYMSFVSVFGRSSHIPCV